MKKIFLAILMVASLSVCGYSRDVRVVLKNGLERKGELTATNEDSVFIKFKNGKVRKIPFTEITSVIDVKTQADILSAIQAEGKIPAEGTPAPAEAPAAAEPPAAAAAAAAPEAADSAAQTNPAVRVVMKTGPERKGLLVATDEDSIFVKFKNGKTRKILIADITSVIDTQTNKDILSSIQAESKTTEETPAGDKATAAAKAPAAEKGSAVLDVAATFTPTASKQKGLPDNLMGWMAARYGSKTMLGLKWENLDKAKRHYASATSSSSRVGAVKPKKKVTVLRVLFFPHILIGNAIGSVFATDNSGEKSGHRGNYVERH